MSLFKSSFNNTNSTNANTLTVPKQIQQKQRTSKSKKTNRTFILSGSKSILKFNFEGTQQNLQMLKISLKKQNDRRIKLKKLTDVYQNIYAKQKKHVKQIKASIIEMKDSTTASKYKLLIDPTVLVQNAIKSQIREFLCALMNTFYKAYENNQKNNCIIGELNNNMTFLIKGISFNQDMIFRMQKTQINEQVALQGEFLAQKNKVKEQNVKKKEIKELYDNIKMIYEEEKQKYLRKKQVIAQLQRNLKQLNDQSQSMGRNIEYQNNMRDKCQDKIDKQIFYQQKLAIQLYTLTNQVQNKNKQSKILLKQLCEKKVQNANKQMRKSTQNLKSKVQIGENQRQKIKFATINQFTPIRG